MFQWEQTICKAKLDSGEIVTYDAASPEMGSYPGWTFLGEGVIYSVDDIIWVGLEKLYFFSKPTTNKAIESNEKASLR